MAVLYGKAQVGRLIGEKPRKIESIDADKMQKVLLVKVKGKRPTFVSKRKVREAFIEYRRQGAAGLQVAENQDGGWTVTNPQNGNEYQLEPTESGIGISCTCEDMHAQTDAFGVGCCKHTFAVLESIGLSDFQPDIFGDQANA